MLEGNLKDEELVELAKFFSPISSSNKILNDNFYNLTYWSRHNDCMDNALINRNEYKPPSSIWNLRWPMHNVYSCSKPESSIKLLDLLNLDFTLDSQITYGNKNQVKENQFVLFPKNEKKNQVAWFRIFNKATFPIKKPASSRLPNMSSFSGYSSFNLNVLNLKSNLISSNIYVATFNNFYGPHDALWWDDENAYLLQLSAGTNNSIEYFKEIFSALV